MTGTAPPRKARIKAAVAKSWLAGGILSDLVGEPDIAVESGNAAGSGGVAGRTLPPHPGT